MKKTTDEIGNKYGKLTVITRVLGKKKDYIRWLCICDCGNEVIVPGADLRRGHTKSCGCYQKERSSGLRTPINKQAINIVYHNCKTNAKTRNYIWELTKDQVSDIIVKPCHYCGEINSNVITGRYTGYPDFHYNGIDRLNNDLGYTIDNTVPCCFYCNKAKWTRTKEEFLAWLIKTYNYNFKED